MRPLASLAIFLAAIGIVASSSGGPKEAAPVDRTAEVEALKAQVAEPQESLRVADAAAITPAPLAEIAPGSSETREESPRDSLPVAGPVQPVNTFAAPMVCGPNGCYPAAVVKNSLTTRSQQYQRQRRPLLFWRR